MITQINESTAFLSRKGITEAEVGIILGTGLGRLVEYMDIEQEISYEDIPHFPVSTVEFHTGKLIYGTLSGKKVLAMQGRFHFYEGYTLQQVTYPVRVMKKMGIHTLLVSNACGGMNLEKLKKGDLMILEDHIDLLSGNPLTGKHYPEFGPRFPDMSQPYSKKLIEIMHSVAKNEGIDIKEGVYVAVSGPNLETRAEYRFLRMIGADVVGMSTVPEVIVANQMGMQVAAVSVITDECDPENLHPVELEDILAVAGLAEKKLVKVFMGLLGSL